MKKLLLLPLFFITACTQVPSFLDLDSNTNSGYRSSPHQTSFDVQRITISSIYQRSSAQEGYVHHLMPQTPDKITREWLKSRFVVGDRNTNTKLVVFIKDSSVTQKPVLRNGVLDTEYAVYRANIDLEIKIQQGSQTIGAVFSKAFEERVVGNYLSISEKNKIWQDLVYTALEKTDVELQVGIDRYLNEYVSGF